MRAFRICACCAAVVFASGAPAATPLDEDAWPQVAPQYLDGGRKRAPRPPAQKDAQKSVRRFDRKVSARVEMVNGSPEFVIDGKPMYALWGVTSSHSPTGRHSDMPLNVITIWSSSLRWHPGKTTVLDVFGRRIVARGVDSFEFDAKLHETYLFYLSDDADALLEKLNNLDNRRLL